MARLIIGNWKMNLGPGEASTLLVKIEGKLTRSDRVEVVVCPAFIDLVPLAKQVNKSVVKLGAQNLHPADHGPYTGEISAPMLSGLVTHVIVGHSERRALGEDDKFVAAKVAAAVRSGLTPILCVGESLTEREHKLSTKVVVDQVTAALSGLTAREVRDVVVAYEPVWAIGTGQFATPDQVRPVIAAIRTAIEDLYGEAGGMGVRLLYGGSVDADNAAAYLATPGVDGLLVGGASLNSETFGAIVAAADREA